MSIWLRCSLLALFISHLGFYGGCTASEPAPPSNLPLSADCTGNNCSTINDAYSGTGTGVWAAENKSNGQAAVEINLTGIPAQAKVTLVFTNQSSDPQNMLSDAIRNTTTGISTPVDSHLKSIQTFNPSSAPDHKYPQNLNRQKIDIAKKNVAAAGSIPPAVHYTLGEQHLWTDAYATSPVPVVATLRSQMDLSNGKKVNIWVQNSEWASDKVTQAIVDIYAQKFGAPKTGVFDMVTTLYGGQPWGPYPAGANGTLINPDQDIQIVLLTMDLYSGYFSRENNQTKNSSPSSNEVLAFFMNAKDSYDPRYGIGYATPVLAHEFVHMINNYQRTTLSNYLFESWLEEMSAMGLQEMVGNIFNPDDKLGWWFKQWADDNEYNCQLNTYSFDHGNCSSYDVGGSFMSYLMRQYGLTFYRDLVAAPVVDRPTITPDGINALDAAIKKQDPNSSFLIALRRWGASIAMLDSSKLPTGYGYPERVETVNTVSYTLKGLNGADFAGTQTLPTALPAILSPYAHAPIQFTGINGTFSRKVLLPPKTALTVVIN